MNLKKRNTGIRKLQCNLLPTYGDDQMTTIETKTNIKLGVVPTHIQFVDGLVPDDAGNMPRDESGQIKVVSGMKRLVDLANAKMNCVQVSLFPASTIQTMQKW